MKKLSLRYIMGIIPVVTAFNIAIAQGEKKLPLSNEALNDYSLIKKSNLNPISGPIALVPAVSEKTIKNFKKQFRNTENERWSNTDNGHVVEFNKGGISTRVFYTSKGVRSAMIRTYMEDKLPTEIRHIVKSEYYDFNIVVVFEVEVMNKLAYLVKMENKKQIKTIRVMDGEMDEYESFVRIN